MNQSTMITTIGLRSSPPKEGSILLTGAITGSVTWVTTRLMASKNVGYGGRIKRGTKDNIALTNMATVKRIMK